MNAYLSGKSITKLFSQTLFHNITSFPLKNKDHINLYLSQRKKIVLDNSKIRKTYYISNYFNWIKSVYISINFNTSNFKLLSNLISVNSEVL